MVLTTSDTVSSPAGDKGVVPAAMYSCSREIEERRQLNSGAPVSKLPPEVLSSIFSGVQDDYVAALTGKVGFHPPLADGGSELWNGFTHVCHNWREVALGTPELWTRVVSSPSNNKWTQELLLRSQRRLLTCVVEGSLDSYDSASGRSELIKQLGRCHTLSMRKVPPNDLRKYLSSKVDAPRLEYLVIGTSDSLFQGRNPFILSDSHLHAPSLRRLELEGCAVDWESRFLSRLTHLWLESLPFDSKLECNELIKVLAGMPFLEEVYLSYDCIENEDTDIIPFPDNTPTLHHLQRLEIVDDVRNLARFLNNITLPLISKLHMSTYDFIHEAAPHLPLVFDWLSHRFTQPAGDDDVSGLAPLKCIRTLVLHELEDEFTIQGFNGLFYFDRGGPLVDPLFVFNFLTFDRISAPWFGEFAHVFFPLLPTSSIVSLDVSIQGFYLSTSCWITVFGSIPTLESICLSTNQPQHFFSALYPTSVAAQVLPFPALKSITLFAPMSPIDYNLFAGILSTRSSYGMRQLESVSFLDAHPPPYEALSELMEVVSSVGLYHIIRATG